MKIQKKCIECKKKLEQHNKSGLCWHHQVKEAHKKNNLNKTKRDATRNV